MSQGSTTVIASRVRHLILQPVEAGPNGHGLDVSLLVHAVVVAPGLAQRLVQPSLQLLQHHHPLTDGLTRSL
jgi:hypothetical protein